MGTQPKQYIDIKSHKRAFIIGGGTTLKAVMDNKALKNKLEKEDLIGCNKAVEDFKCKYMIYQDSRFARRFVDTINKFDGDAIFAPKGRIAANNKATITEFEFSHKKPANTFEEGLFTSGNCGTGALSLAITLGYKNIFLCGMDCRYSLDKKETHYHGGYKWGRNRPQIKENGNFSHMIWGFRQIGRFVKEFRNDIELYNVTTFYDNGKPFSMIDPNERCSYTNITMQEALTWT
jgi:hypothetical protein